MPEKPIYIITGGPGFGKTQLIDALKKAGYLCSGEFARDLIERQMACNGEILPWKNARLFQEEILRKRIGFFESVPEGHMAFADRGIPDQLAFASHKGFQTSGLLLKMARKYRYAKTVFLTPPWPEIFENDLIRTESFEEAQQIDWHIRETYSGLNYQIIDLPLVSVEKRKEIILEITQNQDP
jgi:predicted ATPase